MDMYGCALRLVIAIAFACIVSGVFQCYQCSYERDYNKAEWNKEECMTNPEAIRPTFPCNETSYCITQEKIDRYTGRVNFFYRSCSRTPMDYCTTNEEEMLNAISCQGELCNNHTELYQICPVTTENITSNGYEISSSLDSTISATTTPNRRCNIKQILLILYLLL